MLVYRSGMLRVYGKMFALFIILFPSGYENNEEIGWQREVARNKRLPGRIVGLEDTGRVIHTQLQVNLDITY